MEFNKEKYEELMLRFALEIDEVGVTRNLLDLIAAQIIRAPNTVSATADEATDRFVYRHDGFMIEAVRTVKLTVKRCT